MVHFVLKSTEDDLIGYFERDPSDVIDNLIDYAYQLEDSGPIDISIIDYLTDKKMDHLQNIENSDQDYKDSLIKEIDQELDKFFEAFFWDQKDKDLLRPRKKDYLD